MQKIKDSQTLGIVSGMLGGLVMLAFDQISNKLGMSKRPYYQASSGMWVNSKREGNSRGGTILGVGMVLGSSALGGIAFTEQLSKKGTDNLITKGAFYGSVYGAIITAVMSGLPTNKVKPRDATSNLSYVLAHMLYGIAATQAISKLGDQSIFYKSPSPNDLSSDHSQYHNQVKQKNNLESQGKYLN
ncbi:hypothetical protein [Dehalobacter sp. TeCB1]|uniref:hypothetical protein n=1 Tax=Dehalobacter sp. TeCB1 TaxID=1843715 RepID=UPI00083AD88A|nr:hypothetical protein [Dehalobacter sp. TeCB1]OCZ54270.1 hypothetical protein A7D23_05740 [Dehalobacter sp. TeCB1]